jgi:hypothetical protein
MALTALDYFKPLRNLGGGCIPTLEVVKATGVTWSKGDLIVSNTGLAVVGADDAAVATILGIALEDAVTGSLRALIAPALPNVTFWARLGGDDAGATTDSAAAQRYVSGTGAGFEIDLATVFYINVGSTTISPVMIINFIDDIGTAWGAVEFVFASSAFNAVT